MKKTVRGLVATLLLTGITLYADPLVTDRPDFTESNEIVIGTTQIEAGYTMTDIDATEHVVGEILVRHGLNNHTELRVGIPSFSQVNLNGSSTSGFSDTTLGVKLKFNKSDAWILGTTLPTGSDDFKDDALNPFVKWCYTKGLGDRYALSTNLGAQGIGSGSERTIQGLGSLSLGIGLTERFGNYYEYYFLSPIEKNGDTHSFFNIGATYLVTDDFQLDARLGKDLTEGGFFVGAGVAYRL